MEDLPAPMRRALELAWEATLAGSLGIGAVITDAAGTVVASGRNRLAEDHAGDDHLAGTSLAHAEMNALAKLRWGAHGNDRLALWTALEPCLQCAGAIRMAPIAEVHVLAPDPLFRGMEGMQALAANLGGHWPDYHEYPADEHAAFVLLLLAHTFAFWGIDNPVWTNALPRLTQAAQALKTSGELVELVAAKASLDDALEAVRPHLTAGVDDVKECWNA
jgi:tRNA(adenine34) deaminase